MENKSCKMLNMAAIIINIIFIFSFFFPSIALTINGSDTDGFQTYIVRLQKPKQGNFSTKLELQSWYQTFLPEIIPSKSMDDHQPRMVHCYENVFSGFAARLTAEEVKAMETKKGFISAHVEKTLQSHTTHTPNFLGLHQNSGFWKESNLGKGVIIGVLDSGIKPDHPSFRDEGMPPPPAKWKGKCDPGITCNNKIIGARSYVGNGPPIDNSGHGTHTASTAAGNFVSDANLFGQANGTAVGIAPLAHLAIYRICEPANNCLEGAAYSAIDDAIKDGVDVISLSVGFDSSPFFEDGVAMATLKAVEQGIFVSCSAGNDGPKPSTLSNEAPWMLTVGASTTDRSIAAMAQLGNQATYEGETLVQPKDFPPQQFPLYYPVASNVSALNCSPESLDGSAVNGKVVLCMKGGGMRNRQMEEAVKNAGGVAMILMNGETEGYSVLANAHILPAVEVSYAAGESIKAYVNSTSSPTAAIVFKGSVIGKKSAPEIAFFSSRGPNKVSPGILKPDIIGPGVDIIAAWPFSKDNNTNTNSTFAIISGTSMACPHLSGIAALLKSTHPDWSPAAIKSAIMSTADTVNLEGKPIIDHNLSPADMFAIGAGHVNPSKSNDPGLIYDTNPNDYVPYLCGLNYTSQKVTYMVDHDVQCESSSIAEAALNYPSFSIKLGAQPQTYNRTVTNVGQAVSTYASQIFAPEGVEISVIPDKLSFMETNQKATYSVTFTKSSKANNGPYSGGYLRWVSAQHIVTSPIVVTFE